MRASTEDLLTIRDGEPIDARLRERIVADRENAEEIERLRQVAEGLRRLPTLEPPPGTWDRIAAETRWQRTASGRRAAYWAAAAALIVAVSALLVDIARRSPPPETTTVDTIDFAPPPGTPAATAAARDPAPATAPGAADAEPVIDYSRLVAESVRLELLLAELDDAPRLMNAGTAGTIADLEDHIVLVDEQLNFAEARDMDPRYRQALWRERVDVMNALLHVRYAQVQIPSY